MHSHDRREQDMEIALRLQKMELEMEALREDLSKNTEATKELLEAWKASKFTLNLAKSGAAIATAGLGLYMAFQKVWGHQ